MAQGLSKSSTLPAVSIGFALSILVATWVASGRFREMQTIDLQNATLIEDIRSRQSKYIGVSGLLTQRIDDRLWVIDARLCLNLETLLALHPPDGHQFVKGTLLTLAQERIYLASIILRCGLQLRLVNS